MITTFPAWANPGYRRPKTNVAEPDPATGPVETEAVPPRDLLGRFVEMFAPLYDPSSLRLEGLLHPEFRFAAAADPFDEPGSHRLARLKPPPDDATGENATHEHDDDGARLKR